MPSGIQVVAGVPDQVLHQLVADVPGLPVGQPRLAGAGRRHHVRRVGGDQVEAAIPYGFVERAVQQLGLDPVEGEGQRGELQGPAVHVGRGDRLGVGGQVQGLHAAAGAEIERGAHRPPDRELGQRAGGRGQTEHEVGAHRRDVTVQARSEVGEHPEVGCRRRRTGAGPPPPRSCRPPRRSVRIPARSSGATRPGSAASRAARSTGRCSGHNLIKVASGSSRPISARSAGTVWLRARAACAIGPIAATTRSTV